MKSTDRRRYLFFGFVLAAFLLCVLVSPIQADIYMYIDQNGVVHFTNVLTTSEADYRVYIKESRGNTYSRSPLP